MKNDIQSLQENINSLRSDLELMPETSVLGRMCIQALLKRYEKKIESLQNGSSQIGQSAYH